MVVTPGCTQFGSESIRTTVGFGGAPSNAIRPVTCPAVAGSTGLTVGGGVAGAALSVDPPPHAAVPVGQRGNHQAHTKESGHAPGLQTSNYHTPPPPASATFRSTRSCIHFGSHHSTGFTGWPLTSIVKCR